MGLRMTTEVIWSAAEPADVRGASVAADALRSVVAFTGVDHPFLFFCPFDP